MASVTPSQAGRRFGIPALAATAAMLLLGACATYPTMAERTAMLAGNAEYHAPPQPGRAPLVILMSGCGGVVRRDGGPKNIMNDYAAAANRAGAYAIVVDSFGSRGLDFRTAVQMTCSGLRLRGDARAGDILAAEELARRHWRDVDFSGVILAGWSHGGWAVMELLSAGPSATRIGNFRIDRPAPNALTPDAVALFYPYCGFLNSTARSRWDFRGPLFLLLTGINSGRPAQCTSAIEQARGGSDDIEVVVFHDATPAFDEDDHSPGSNYRWDPEAAARAHALFERFVSDQKARLK